MKEKLFNCKQFHARISQQILIRIIDLIIWDSVLTQLFKYPKITDVGLLLILQTLRGINSVYAGVPTCQDGNELEKVSQSDHYYDRTSGHRRSPDRPSDVSPFIFLY